MKRLPLPRTILIALSLLPFLLDPAAAQLRKPATPAPACPAGAGLCSGAYGSQCYSPAAGQTCSKGAVCQSPQKICQGQYGSNCYIPSEGQQCMQGLVCQSGQQLCAAGGFPHCYSPANGERCQ